MRIRTVVPVVFLALAAATGLLRAQQFEATVYLPDEFGGVPDPVVLGSSPNGEEVYVCGANGNVVILDGRTDHRIARISVGGRITAVCYCPEIDRVYLGSAGTNSVVVLNATTHSVRGRIPVLGETSSYSRITLVHKPDSKVVFCANATNNKVFVIAGDEIAAEVDVAGSPWTLVYDEASDRLFCASTWEKTVTVIDGTSFAVLATVELNCEPYSMAYCPAGNKLYCAGGCAVEVVDCSNYQRLDSVPLPITPYLLSCDPVRKRVYCAGGDGAALHVIDVASDVAIGSVPLPNHVGDMVFDASRNAVYVSCPGSGDPLSDSVIVVNAETLERTGICAGVYPAALLVQPGGSKVYCAHQTSGKVSVIDPVSHGVKTVLVGAEPSAIACAPGRKRLFTANRSSSNISVINTETNRTIATVALGYSPLDLVYNPVHDKLHSVSKQDDAVLVHDIHNSNVIATIPVGDYPSALACNPANGNVYCGNLRDNTVSVIDGATDAVVATVQVERDPALLLLEPNKQKLFCAGDDEVVVIDAVTNTVQATAELEFEPYALAHTGYPQDYKLYCATEEQVVVFNSELQPVAAIELETDEETADMVYAAAGGKVFCSTGEGIAVIDARTDVIEQVIPVLGAGSLICDTAGRRVYCTCESETGPAIAVLDAATGDLLALVDIESGADAIIAVPELGRVYATNPRNSSVTVVNTTALPRIAVSPGEFRVAFPGTIPRFLRWTRRIMMVMNTGGGTLRWRMEADPPVDWLTINPAASPIPLAPIADVELEFNARNLSRGTYSTAIVIKSNAQNAAELRVPVALDVVGWGTGGIGRQKGISRSR